MGGWKDCISFIIIHCRSSLVFFLPSPTLLSSTYHPSRPYLPFSPSSHPSSPASLPLTHHTPLLLNPPISLPHPPSSPSHLTLLTLFTLFSLLLGEAWANIGAIHMHERSFDKALHALQEGKKHKPRYSCITSSPTHSIMQNAYYRILSCHCSSYS